MRDRLGWVNDQSPFKMGAKKESIQASAYYTAPESMQPQPVEESRDAQDPVPKDNLDSKSEKEATK